MSRLANTLPLHVFIKRQQVLRLYRQLLKTARGIEDEQLRASLREEVRIEFKNSKSLVDKVAIKTAIIQAQKSLTQLEDLSSRKSTASSGNTSKAKVTGSWLDSSESGDIRGRVGTGWPWK